MQELLDRLADLRSRLQKVLQKKTEISACQENFRSYGIL